MRKKIVWMGGIAILGLALSGLAAWAQDEATTAAEKAVDQQDPDAVDPNLIKGEKWTLDFTFERPEPILITTPEGEKKVYWYVVYTVTNKTGAEREFVPLFTLYSDTTTVQKAGMHPWVFDKIKKSRRIPFLENAVKMIGKILPGEDNARTGVAIFEPLDRKTDAFTIFVAGLSGEYIEKENPAAKEDTPEDQKIVRLRKTLALTYKLPGDEWWLNLDQPLFVSKKWTWR